MELGIAYDLSVSLKPKQNLKTQRKTIPTAPSTIRHVDFSNDIGTNGLNKMATVPRIQTQPCRLKRCI